MSEAALILVLNCGSSSIKLALFDTGADPAAPVPRQPLWQARAEGIAGHAPSFEESGCAPVALPRGDGASAFHAALQHGRERAMAAAGHRRLRAVSHRVVHGGMKYTAPVAVDADVLADLRSYIPLAPLHQPFALEAIEACLADDAAPPQIACFDTAFHHTMPKLETLLPLSLADWDRGLRRYGFHGLSYEFIATVLREDHPAEAQGRVIVAHLGSGASLCALRGFESVSTTMGFSALDGLMMGTRCGAIDPGALLYLMETDGLTPAALGQLLYHRSGLLGVSGVSADPRDLLDKETADEHVRTALALYVHRIVREIGALTAVLGGLEMLVFTAGIGEHNAVIRARVCEGLGFLGASIDADANRRGDTRISSAASRLPVLTLPTNEEWIAASHARACVASDQRQELRSAHSFTDPVIPDT